MSPMTEQASAIIKVLLVEDSPTEAMIIQASLADAEDVCFEITHTLDLKDTLQHLVTHQYDIVVLDLTLPDSSGIETFTKVQQAKPDVPIVILTANTNKNMAVQSVQMGAQDYIVKEQVENMQLVLSIRYAIMRAEAEAKQKALMEELARVNKELEAFAYIVSHDLKAPLRGIRTVVDWLVADYGDNFNEEGREQLDLLTGRVDRMHNLIEGVLRYSRAGRQHEACMEMDLNLHLAEIVDTLAPPEHIKITIERPMPRLICESMHVTQLFQNLISNAIKYNDKAEGLIQVACADEDETWHFTVRDNGSGIPEKQFQRIFDMFTTLKARDQYESTGVGLPIVKKIVETNGGSVWVESTEGQGSTFHVRWPKTPPREPEEQPAATAESTAAC